jgi:magnesium transporter
MPELFEQDHTQLRLLEVKQALDSGMFVHVRRMLHSTPACDIALLLESCPPKGRAVLWQLVDPEQHGDILEELAEDVKDSIIRLMDPELVAAATEGMDTDDLAYVLRNLPDTVYREVLGSMDAQDRQRVEQALAYPEETAGSIMNTDTVTLRPDVTIDVVIRYLRLRGELPEATDVLYVVDQQDKLIGDVSLSTLLTTDPSYTVAEVMDNQVEVIDVAMPDNDVAQLFERHDWISAPVVDSEKRLLGRITIDDVVDIIREDAEHSMMSMAGLDDDEDTFAPAFTSARRRSVWLGVNLLTALLAAFVSNMFEDILDQIATLAILMTIVPSMGGIAGSQTLTLVIRGIAVGHIGDSNQRWLLSKEALVALMNGVMWALLIAVVVAVWKQSLAMGGIIAFAMLVNLLFAGIAGVLIPLAMKRMNIDPALAGGVVLTTITDVVGLFAFLGSATLLFG